MEVAVAGIFHETNTFASRITRLSDFHAYQYAEGPELLQFESTRSELGGFLTSARIHGWTVKPCLYAAAVPSGIVDHDAFEEIVQRTLDRALDGRLPDAVLLTLHGAMVTEEEEDADGEYIRRFVAALGPQIPIVATLDLHANVTDRMVEGVDSLIAYDTYPHVDMFDRGWEAAITLYDIVQTGIRRSTVHRKAPVITVPLKQGTSDSPMAQIMDRAHAHEADAPVQVSVVPGFPYADADFLGLSVLVSSRDRAENEAIADDMAGYVWTQRAEFEVGDLVPVDQAVRQAMAAVSTPVVLVDSADNIGGGSPGDGTEILREWLRAGGTGLVITVADPQTVERAVAASIGASIHVSLGGKTDELHGRPVDTEGQVKSITDGTYVHTGTYNRGFVTHMGRTVILDVHANTVVVSERKAMPFDAQQLLSLGVDPQQCRALVVKSAIAWKAAYGSIAADVVLVDTPGICTNLPTRIDGLRQQLSAKRAEGRETRRRRAMTGELT